MSFYVRDTADEEVLSKLLYKQKSGDKTVINRGSTEEMLLLDDYKTIHYYNYSSIDNPMSDFYIPTSIVENAVYEVHFNCSGSANSNNDLRLCPYVGSFGSGSYYYTQYQTSEDNEQRSIVYRSFVENAGFFFDFFPGSKGYDPIGKFTVYNTRACKKLRLEAGDTCSTVVGSGYWLDGSGASEEYSLTSTTPPAYNTNSTWTGIGFLQFGQGLFKNWQVFVSRIA
jgi:hypothetical protein